MAVTPSIHKTMLRFAGGFSRLAPGILVGSALATVVFLTIVSCYRGFGQGLVSLLGLLTGVSAPESGWSVGFSVLAWLVTLSGWLLLPTCLALLIGTADREAELTADLDHQIERLVKRARIGNVAQSEALANELKASKEDWMSKNQPPRG